MDVIYDYVYENRTRHESIENGGVTFRAREIKNHTIEKGDLSKLLRTLPPKDHITYEHESLKIAKTDDSLIISFFGIHQKTRYINYKHRFRKNSFLRKYIIKQNNNNFFVSTSSFSSRQKYKKIRQNVLTAREVFVVAHRITALLFKGKNQTKAGVADEVTKFFNIIFNELNIPKTKEWYSWNIEGGYDHFISSNNFDDTVQSILTNGIIYSLLEWFCNKNNIHFNGLWELRLMSLQYFTKKELKKYNNDYLQTFFDYFKIRETSENKNLLKKTFSSRLLVDLPIYEPQKKSKVFSFYDEFHSIDFIGISIYDRLIQNLKESKLDLFLNYSHITSHITNNLKLWKDIDREQYIKFLDYLTENSAFFEEFISNNYIFCRYTSSNNPTHKTMYAIDTFISRVFLLFRLGILVDFSGLSDIINNYENFMHESKKFLRYNSKYLKFDINHKFKSEIIKSFTKNKEKWGVVLLSNSQNKYHHEITFYNTLGYVVNEETGEKIEFIIENMFRDEFNVSFNGEDINNFMFNRYKVPYTLTSKETQKYSSLALHNTNDNNKIKGLGAPILKERVLLWEILLKVYNRIQKNKKHYSMQPKLLVPIVEKMLPEYPIFNKHIKIITNE